MTTLDRTRDFGLVTGKTADGCKFRQDGKRFRADGSLIGDQPEAVINENPPILTDTSGTNEPAQGDVKETTTEKIDKLERRDFNIMSAKDIEKLVVKAGGVYKNRHSGISYLLSEQD